MKELLVEFHDLQNEVLTIIQSVTNVNYHHQFHPDLSPVGWHLGHCIYTESYWIREKLLNQDSIDESLKSLYVPELSHKPSRSSSLPDKIDLLDWAITTQKENYYLLESALLNKSEYPLLKDNYLVYFLIQHYSQHIETMHMVLTEIQIQQLNTKFISTKKLNPIKLIPDTRGIESSSYNIGSEKKHRYDNEQPVQTIKLDSFQISTLPVNNSEFLQFIYEDGYTEKKHWSTQGWDWINKAGYKHPHHWRLDNNSLYYGVDHNGAYSLEESHPVHGLSYYEAEAFAKWCDARLPHEYEWEVAARNNLLQKKSIVWEWCQNTFHPYPGFSAFPYEGYSVPYFDEKHYVLRGGSIYTKKQINRSSFRNYYAADKRHIFAGIRLVFD